MAAFQPFTCAGSRSGSNAGNIIGWPGAPMIEALHPSTLGEILDRTVQLYRSRFLVFLGIAMIPAGVILACAAAAFLFLAWMGSGASAVGTTMVGVLSIFFFAGGALIVLPLCIAAMSLGSAALTHAASVEFLGEKTTIRSAYRAAWKRGWRYTWLLILQALFLVVAPLVVWTILIVVFAVFAVISKSTADSNVAGGAVVLLLFAILASYSLWMLLRLCLAFPACVVEEIEAWAALKRAFSLSRDTRGRILVLYLLGAVLGWILSLVLSIPVLIVVSMIPGMNTPQHQQTMGMIILFTFYGSSFAVQALTKPVYAIAILVFYYDQRIRKEGFDIEWMMRQAGMLPPPAPEPQPWLPALPMKPRHASPDSSTASEASPTNAEPALAQIVPEVVETSLIEPAADSALNSKSLQKVSGEPA
jgi:hypothetical protein